MNAMSPRWTCALLAAAALLGLTACGYRDDLQRPPPMWGEAREQYEREEAARRQAEEAEETAEQPAPQN